MKSTSHQPIGLNQWGSVRRIRALTFIPAIMFLLEAISLLLRMTGMDLFKDISDFFLGTAIGIAITVVLSISFILFSTSAVASYVHDQKLKMVRYRIAYYLDTAGPRRGSKTDVEVMAERLEVDPRTVIVALEVMMGRGEVRGRIDDRKGLFFIGNLTMRGRLLKNFLTPQDKRRIDLSE